MLSAAEGSTDLAKLTPHRVMRELYEQAVAYWRAYAEAVPSYSPTNDPLARVATAASNAISNICSAIVYGSAASRSPLISPSPSPYGAGPVGDPDNPVRYVRKQLSVCPAWISAAQSFDNDTVEWLSTNPNTPATQWSPEQQDLQLRMATLMGKNAGEMQNLGAQSQNPVFDDFASLLAQYRRAYVQSIPTYVAADAYLANTAAELSAVNSHACRAAGAQ
ncbi:hypothetical protein FHR72_000399 [Mycolicibacterium iranicum]|uniref:Uncharacterized protein n=1 Tax=Mycolicibacterium iranicum TaxID=912594 RepID=A0A839Q6X3_MYCIR|nr:hypothetical protein [Mycolicibacterium iranicum]MBB2988942.1 hypothetical protein [Mycolicibacterium iranicum]